MSEAQGPNFSADGPAPGAEPGDSDLLDKFARWDSDLLAHWSKWAADAKLWYAFVAGDQWTTDEIAQLEEGSKIPVTFNLAGPVIDAVQGAEIANRQIVNYYPRNAEKTGVADVLTQGAAYVNDECNGDQEDSEAFYDALVCGMGWTETRPEVDGDEVSIIKERVDPLQMRVDPSSRKRCTEDARYLKREIPMSRDEFDDFKVEVGRPDLSEGELEGALDAGKRRTVVNPRQRYTNGLLGEGAGEVVTVCEWQWWEREPVYVAALPDPSNPQVTKVQKVDEKTFNQLKALDAGIKHTKSMQKVYYRAFATANEVLHQERLPENTFRYKCITGKRDRNNGTWFGLVKPMFDPGKFVNKLYSEVMHIIRTNAAGGMALEEDAVSDVRQFEQSWSSTDRITWLKPGALSGTHGSKMLPKSPPPIQQALFQLMEFARDMVKATTGVNEEILGLVGREQAGVLEAQRKQAAYGILSAFFDAKRRYQREQGRLLLAMIRQYIPDDKLVRIVLQGEAQYVSLAKAAGDDIEMDVIVDDAPAGPDQKAKISAVLMPLIPELLQGGLIGPDVVADVVMYLDIPSSVAQKIADAIRKQAQAQSTPDPMHDAEVQKVQAQTKDHLAGAAAKEARAFKDVTDAHATHVGLGADFLQHAIGAPAGVAVPPNPAPAAAAGGDQSQQGAQPSGNGPPAPQSGAPQ